MDDERFFAIATEVVNGIESDLRRARPEERGKWRGLEIGCGSGRLMRAMSRHFSELHGAEASAETASRAQDYLRDLPNTRVVQAEAEQLAPFEPHAYDFVYALDPSLAALRQIRRVLKAGGYCWIRFEAMSYDSPLPTRVDLLEFAQNEDFQVLALENVGGHGLWTAWRKQPRGWHASLQEQNQREQNQQEQNEIAAAGGSVTDFPVVIRRITNASSSEPVAPCRGRFASISIRAEHLPADAGLHHLRVTVGDSFATVTYIGPQDHSGYRQIRADLPELEATGLLPVQLRWLESPISAPRALRVIPPGPSVPQLISVSTRITAHSLKLTAEEIARPDEIQVLVGGLPVQELGYTCTDRRARRFEIAVEIPAGIAPGKHALELRIGRRKMPAAEIEVIP